MGILYYKISRYDIEKKGLVKKCQKLAAYFIPTKIDTQ